MLRNQSDIQQSFLPPFLNIQLHSFQACVDHWKWGKARENSEGVGWGVPFDLYAQAHTKHNTPLQCFNQGKPLTVRGDGEAEMLMYWFHLLHSLQYAARANWCPGEVSLRPYTQKPVAALIFADRPLFHVLRLLTWALLVCPTSSQRGKRMGNVSFVRVMVLGLCVLPSFHLSYVGILLQAAEEEFEGCKYSIGHNLGIPLL